MRWSCPHCGVNLAVSDEKLNAGWSFSRCYKCGGFALVRKAEINLLKVDKAPVGENVLLPEGSETPVLSNEAKDNLENILRKSTQENKPAVIPATKKPPELVPPVPRFLTEPHASETSSRLSSVVGITARYRALPVAIGIAGTLAVTSGVYLFLQGQALWQNVNPRTTAHTLVSDQLHQAVMAPIRHTENSPAPITLPVQNLNPPASEPAKLSLIEDEELETNTHLRIRVTVNNSKLRTGPGLGFSIVGYANTMTEYVVLDWRDRWFKIAPSSAENVANYGAWIRNDLVQMVNN